MAAQHAFRTGSQLMIPMLCTMGSVGLAGRELVSSKLLLIGLSVPATDESGSRGSQRQNCGSRGRGAQTSLPC